MSELANLTAPRDGETTRDAFLDGRITALQLKAGPRAAIDALFLAAAIPAVPGKRHTVLEAGTGSGVASLALCARVKDVQVTGVEIQPALAKLARENARANGLERRFAVIEADVAASRSAQERAGLSPESFNHVAANPPFFVSGTVRDARHPAAARAYTAEPGALEHWVRFVTAMVRPRGTVTLIHRPEVLDELLALLKGRFGGLRVYPLFPGDRAPAKRVIVQGVKGSRAPLKLLSGMVLHEADGGYTEEAASVLRHMAALDIAGS